MTVAPMTRAGPGVASTIMPPRQLPPVQRTSPLEYPPDAQQEQDSVFSKARDLLGGDNREVGGDLAKAAGRLALKGAALGVGLVAAWYLLPYIAVGALMYAGLKGMVAGAAGDTQQEPAGGIMGDTATSALKALGTVATLPLKVVNGVMQSAQRARQAA